jgi:hypothetical protein
MRLHGKRFGAHIKIFSTMLAAGAEVSFWALTLWEIVSGEKEP